jgi:hypothetical protein
VRTVIMRAAAAAESEFGGSSDAPAGLWDPAVAAGSDPDLPSSHHRARGIRCLLYMLKAALHGRARTMSAFTPDFSSAPVFHRVKANSDSAGHRPAIQRQA